ncbi:MAG: hypothetical protein ACEQR8_10320 [Cypionkella sp.]
MWGDRSEAAVQRIEAALARIARVADSAPAAAASPNVLALIDRHETLREQVAAALAELDAVIAEIEP